MYKIHEASGIIHHLNGADRYKQIIINGIKIATVSILTVAIAMLAEVI